VPVVVMVGPEDLKAVVLLLLVATTTNLITTTIDIINTIPTLSRKQKSNLRNLPKRSPLASYFTLPIRVVVDTASPLAARDVHH
jgi:hypothetical protein